MIWLIRVVFTGAAVQVPRLRRAVREPVPDRAAQAQGPRGGEGVRVPRVRAQVLQQDEPQAPPEGEALGQSADARVRALRRVRLVLAVQGPPPVEELHRAEEDLPVYSVPGLVQDSVGAQVRFIADDWM